MNTRLSNIVERLLQNQKRIAVVKLAVGELIPLDEDQWRGLVNSTTLASSALEVRLIRAEQQCMTCFEKYHPENLQTRCPRCGGVGAKILAGEELYLESVEEEE
jgi:Zn finger protein HypA/HybF involved in hydrogenase expression